jgi:hypothetical protein
MVVPAPGEIAGAGLFCWGPGVRPRPLIKWKSFWLGTLVLGFLAWTWTRGKGHNESVSCGIAGHSAGIGNSHGHLGVFYNGINHPGVRYTGNPGATSYPFHSPVDATARKASRTGPTHAHVFVAHWFLIVVFLVSWLGFLFWRIRRQRKPSP